MSRDILALGAPLSGVKLLAHGRDEVHAELVARARAEGEQHGRASAAHALDEAVERVQELIERHRPELARIATELALEIARVLLRTERARGGYDLERIVRETLGEAAVGRSPCVVHLNPADHERLGDVRFRSGTRLEPDEGVARGDVHVETPLGLLVRDLDGALEAIGKRLQEQLE